jgi:multisubunit Na+/H+ antiporter MnhE subunit
MLAWATDAILLTGTYLVFAGQLSAAEIAVGVILACGVATFGLLIRRISGRHYRLRAPWPRLITRGLLSLMRDVPRVGLTLPRALAGNVRGTIIRYPFEHGGDAPDDRARRALVVLEQSLAPNSYVIDLEADALVLHSLAPRPDADPTDRRWKL